MSINNYESMYFGYNAGLIIDIEKAVNGEYSAIACYEQLMEAAPSKEEQEQIREIREDEMRHFKVFSEIYATLTNRTPYPRITEECPEDYCEGLIAAFKDEQETVDFYLDIADKADESYIKEQFRRAAADEQNHAVWFLHYHTDHCM